MSTVSKVPFGNTDGTKFNRWAVIIGLVLLTLIAAVIVLPKMFEGATAGVNAAAGAAQVAVKVADPNTPWIEAAKQATGVKEFLEPFEVRSWTVETIPPSPGPEGRMVVAHYVATDGTEKTIRILLLKGEDGFESLGYTEPTN